MDYKNVNDYEQLYLVAENDDVAEEVREATDGGNTHNECNHRQALLPLGIGELQMMLVLHRTEEQLANNSQDVDCCDYN